MKHFCYILWAALLLAGCQQDQLKQPPVSGNDQLTINPSFEGMPIAQSRAAGADVDMPILKTYGFYLAGYHTTGKIADAASDDRLPNVFAKEASDQQDAVPLVRYTNSKFTLKTIKWQLDDQTYLGFFGWSQNQTIPTTGITTTTTGIIGQTKNVDDKGYPWIEIRNANAPVDQTDVVGTRSIDHQNDAVISAVDLEFRHLLSKISFSAQSSSGAKVVISSARIKYATDKVYKKARYTFGGSVDSIGAYGAYAEYHTGSVVLNSASMTIDGATPMALGSVLLVPQALAAGDVSLELTYAISPNNGGVSGTTQTRTLPLSAIFLGQGNHYLYTIDLQATEIILSTTPTIEPWNYLDTSLPLIDGPKGSTQLLLDGYDKPYQHTDGKWYWLDRSGYNRHAELVGYYDGMHNASDHYYSFTNSNNVYAKVPGFPQITALHADVIVQETGSNLKDQTLLNFLPQGSGNRHFYMHMGYTMNGILYFDVVGAPYAPNNGRLSYDTKSTTYFRRKGMWSFLKVDGGVQRIYENARLRAESSQSGNNPLGTLNDNYIGRNYDGNVSYVKMISAERRAGEMAIDYVEHKKRYNIDDGLPKIEGLKGDVKLLLLGEKEPYTHTDGNVYWLDYSGYNNHMLLSGVSGGTGVVAYDVLNKCYQFNSRMGQQGATSAFPTFPDATIEICSRRGSASSNTAPLSLSSIGQLGGNNIVRVLTGLGNKPHIQVNSFGSTYLVENISNVLNKQLWTVVSSNSPNTITVYQNAKSLGTQTMTTKDRLISSANMTCDVVGFEGDIHYIRITSKAKNQSEVTVGNEEIKKIYNY